MTMKRRIDLLFIPLIIVFLGIMLSDYFMIWVDLDKLIARYPVKFFVIYWSWDLFSLVYCIFYVGILLLRINKILLKLHNLVAFFILFFFTIIFVVVMVSDCPDLYIYYENVYNHYIFGNFFYYLQWPTWDWSRLAYSIFYAVFLLIFLNTKILKLPNKIIFSVILLASISNFIWVIEVLLRGWEGLYWLEYIHRSFYHRNIVGNNTLKYTPDAYYKS
jgi:hypothetical protein